jgi:hypothetical protein
MSDSGLLLTMFAKQAAEMTFDFLETVNEPQSEYSAFARIRGEL